MQLFKNPDRPDHETNCAAFETFMRDYEWTRFFQPNPDHAPWHVQCKIDGKSGDTHVLNFWPHKLKGQYDGPAVEGLFELRRIMARAIDDSQEEFSVVEE